MMKTKEEIESALRVSSMLHERFQAEFDMVSSLMSAAQEAAFQWVLGIKTETFDDTLNLSAPYRMRYLNNMRTSELEKLGYEIASAQSGFKADKEWLTDIAAILRKRKGNG